MRATSIATTGSFVMIRAEAAPSATRFSLVRMIRGRPPRGGLNTTKRGRASISRGYAGGAEQVRHQSLIWGLTPIIFLLALCAAAEPLHGVLKQLAVRGQAEFMFDGLAVGFDGLHRQREFLRDFPRAHAAADHVEDLHFAVG